MLRRQEGGQTFLALLRAALASSSEESLAADSDSTSLLRATNPRRVSNHRRCGTDVCECKSVRCTRGRLIRTLAATRLGIQASPARGTPRTCDDDNQTLGLATQQSGGGAARVGMNGGVPGSVGFLELALQLLG